MDYAVNADIVRDIVRHFDVGEPTIDCFASGQNRRFERHWSIDDSAWTKTWDRSLGLLWMNPPFNSIDAVVRKVKTDKSLAILIVPGWETERWWRDLQNIITQRLLLPSKHGLFLQEGTTPMPAPRWNTWAMLVDGGLHDVILADDKLQWPLHTTPGLKETEVHASRQLTETEVNLIGAKLLEQLDQSGSTPSSLMRHVNSVVRTSTGDRPPHLTKLVEEFKAQVLLDFGVDVLSGKLQKTPPIRGPYGEARINIKHGAQPRRQRAFQLVGERADALKAILEEYVDRGWIEPSYSEWGAPAFVVPKKVAGEWRLVVDYRALNAVTQHDSYGLPLISSLIQKQVKRRMFTVLDMKKGYHQMPLAAESRDVTAMTTPFGLWQWRVMPMGAKNGNAAFQRMMDWILKDLDCADPFVDDVIISSEGDTPEELIRNHMTDLCKVLAKFREHGLVCDMSKAQMFQDEVEFCGQVIGHGRRRPAPGKLRCLEKWRRPETITELRSFLGFCNWYHEYIEMFAEVAAPLMAMLKVPSGEAKKGSKTKLSWKPEAERAFDLLKRKLLDRLELELIDPDAPFILRSDASEYAVGACLEQPDAAGGTRPVGFWSRKLTPGQRSGWTPREKETYAIVEALKHWAGHIGCNPVVILTDHQALQSWYQEKVDTPSGPAGRRARWHELLSKFDLEVHYVPGSMNTVADALSRWAYPASKGFSDVSAHGSAADWADVQRMKAEERSAVKILGVMVTPRQRSGDHPTTGRDVYDHHLGDGADAARCQPGCQSGGEQDPEHHVTTYHSGGEAGHVTDDIISCAAVTRGQAAKTAAERTSPSTTRPETSPEEPPPAAGTSTSSSPLTGSTLDLDWEDHYRSSDTWRDVWTKVHGDQADWPTGFQLRGHRRQFLYHDHRICVPESLAAPLLNDLHHTLGHVGVDKLVKSASLRFDIPGLHQHAINVRRGCQLCQAVARPNWDLKGRWTSTPVPPRLGACISMDIVSLSESKTPDGHLVDSALVVIDRHSGWVDAYPVLKKGLTAKRVAHLLHERWLPVFGIPTEITTDLGQHFAGSWFRTFCALRGIMHAEAVSYRSETNGRAEQAVGAVLDALRKITNDSGGSWVEGLPRALHQLRIVTGPSGMSPHHVVFGRDIILEGVPLPTDKEAEDAVQFVHRMSEVDRNVQHALAQHHQRRQPNQTAGTDVEYQAGQRVWVLRPRRDMKLSTWWTGPHIVKRRVGRDSFLVDVGTKTRTCHRMQMKAWTPPLVGPSWPIHHHVLADEETQATPDDWIVQDILGHRRDRQGQLQFLTRWEGFGAEDDCWEPISSFLQRVNLPWLQYCQRHALDFTLRENMDGLLKEAITAAH